MIPLECFETMCLCGCDFVARTRHIQQSKMLSFIFGKLQLPILKCSTPNTLTWIWIQGRTLSFPYVLSPVDVNGSSVNEITDNEARGAVLQITPALVQVSSYRVSTTLDFPALVKRVTSRTDPMYMCWYPFADFVEHAVFLLCDPGVQAPHAEDVFCRSCVFVHSVAGSYHYATSTWKRAKNISPFCAQRKLLGFTCCPI